MTPTVPSLCTLPTELILEICTYMPSSSAACLAYTSRRLYPKIPPSFYGDLKSRDLADYKALLGYLHKDRPQILICDFCISLHDRTPPWAEEPDENDYFLIVHEPLEPSGESRNVVLNVKRSYLEPVMLRASRAAGTLHNQGMCRSRYSCKGKALLSFPVDDACEDGDEDLGFSATVFWNAELPRVIPRRGRAGPTVTHLTVYKIVLSTTLIKNAPYFEEMRTVLASMGIRCCAHCPMGAVESEVVCKMGQMVYTEEKSKCLCVNGQPEQNCSGHKHVGHEGSCGCSTDVEVRTVGGFGIEVKIWRYAKKMESVGRERLRKRYQFNRMPGAPCWSDWVPNLSQYIC